MTTGQTVFECGLERVGLLRGDIQNGLAVESTVSQGFYNLVHVTPATAPHDPRGDDTRSHPCPQARRCLSL